MKVVQKYNFRYEVMRVYLKLHFELLNSSWVKHRYHEWDIQSEGSDGEWEVEGCNLFHILRMSHIYMSWLTVIQLLLEVNKWFNVFQ